MARTAIRGAAERDYDLGELRGRLSGLEKIVASIPALIGQIKVDVVAEVRENRRLAEGAHEKLGDRLTDEIAAVWAAHGTLAERVGELEKGEAAQKGAAEVKTRMWQRVDVYVGALIGVLGMIGAAAIGLAPMLVQHLGR